MDKILSGGLLRRTFFRNPRSGQGRQRGPRVLSRKAVNDVDSSVPCWATVSVGHEVAPGWALESS